VPDHRVPNDDELNEAIDKIKRAVKAGTLKIVGQASVAERLYDGQHVRPRDVIAWASNRFPKFAFSLSDLPVSADDSSRAEPPLYPGGVGWQESVYEEQLRAARGDKPDRSQDEISSRAELGYLKTIGALLRLLLEVRGKSAVFPSQAAVIAAIETKFPDTSGLSKRELEAKFAQANKSLVAD
jgi:hypothetical protein